MMTKNQINKREQLEMLTIEQLVPPFSTFGKNYVTVDLRHNHEIKDIYGKRKETIERVFADAKEKHGMRWTTLRGLKKMSMQAMLTFAALN
ncbi:hypothetical protein ACA30_20085 [Virgibacillus soli]|uniref:Transposase DDE domain-containing protein n=1 Tax=Lederbergia galactosidilytica TaxID=217031 RepID=A0A178A1U8_9BACI|nr:hypothetical protein ACA30_20085 [Virgibacillus soli]OAK73883.1 hypothetical protein ABB05_05490 [Lederbergia galactosidilytica]